jgi:hypothetical protein
MVFDLHTAHGAELFILLYFIPFCVRCHNIYRWIVALQVQFQRTGHSLFTNLVLYKGRHSLFNNPDLNKGISGTQVQKIVLTQKVHQAPNTQQAEKLASHAQRVEITCQSIFSEN